MEKEKADSKGEVIRFRQGQIRILMKNVQLSSFTATIIILHPTIESG
jgi:hypothetical protein